MHYGKAQKLAEKLNKLAKNVSLKYIAEPSEESSFSNPRFRVNLYYQNPKYKGGELVYAGVA